MHRVKDSFKRGIFLTGTFSLFALHLSAQQSTGSVRGQVVDQLGALIVGASVKLTDANGVTKTVTTDREGNYVISNLAPGKYSLSCGASGFAAYERADLLIVGGRTTRLAIKPGGKLAKQEGRIRSERTFNTEPRNK